MNALFVLLRTRITGFWYGEYFDISSNLNCLQIVDSIMALFRVDFPGRGELSELQQKVAFHTSSSASRLRH